MLPFRLRAFSTAAPRLAAAPKRAAYVPYRRAAPAASSPAAARAPSTAASSTASPAATKATAVYPYEDDDFPLPAEPIEDYASLRKPAAAPAVAARRVRQQPTASPPLTSLPDATYTPLPDADAPSTPSASALASASVPVPAPASAPAPAPEALQPRPRPASIGAPHLQDAYVFNQPRQEDWTTSFAGLSEKAFDERIADALLKPLAPEDVEIKPDGLLYLPEIKYRRTLNAAFGPGGWGMAPRGETHVGPRIVSREWALVCQGRLVAIARGEQEYFDPSGVATATEACKSNALMRCCKDLGIASELWDPRFIREFKAKYCVEAMVEHVTQKKKRKLWRKKDAKFDYPYKELSTF